MFEETAFTVSDADAAAALLQDYQAIAGSIASLFAVTGI